jgi:hypothetical protein
VGYWGLSLHFSHRSWDRCYDFNKVFAEKFGERISAFDSNKRQFFRKNTLVFEKKTPIFSPKIGKNSRKL